MSALQVSSSLVINRHSRPVFRAEITGERTLVTNSPFGLSSPSVAALATDSFVLVDPLHGGMSVILANLADKSMAMVGNKLILSLSFPSVARLTSSQVVLIDDNSKQLQVYNFNGTDFIAVGNPYSLSLGSKFKITGLSATKIALIDDSIKNLQVYEFDGSDWSPVGNPLNINQTGWAITTLLENRIVLANSSSDKLETYDFNGTNWSLVGNSYSFGVNIFNPGLAARNSSQIYFWDTSRRIYSLWEFNDIDWIETDLTSSRVNVGVSSWVFLENNSFLVEATSFNTGSIRIFQVFYHQMAPIVVGFSGTNVAVFVGDNHYGFPYILSSYRGVELSGGSAAIDSQGVLHMCWFEDYGKASTFMYAYCNVANFGLIYATTLIADIGEAPVMSNLYAAMAIDSNGAIHIVYNEYPKIGGTTTYTTMYMNNVGGSWNTPVQAHYVAGYHGSFFAISIDLDNRPVLAFTARFSPSIHYAARGNANNATSFDLYNTASVYVTHTNVLVDASGNHYIIGHTYSPNYTLRVFIHARDNSWSTFTVRTSNYGLGSNHALSAVLEEDTIYFFVRSSVLGTGLFYYTYNITTNTWGASESALYSESPDHVLARWGFWVDNDSQGEIVDTSSGYARREAMELDFAFATSSAVFFDSLMLGSPDITGAVSFVGTGVLAVQSSVVRAASVSLTGAGSLAIQPEKIQVASISLSGAGSLAVSGVVEKAPTLASVSLSGTGTMIVSAQVEKAPTLGAISFQGVGLLAVRADKIIEASVSLSGAGVMTVSAVMYGTQIGAVSMQGAGSLSVSAIVIRQASVSLDGAGTLSVVADVMQTHLGAVVFAGAGSLSVAAQAIKPAQEASVSFSGAGSMSVKAAIITNVIASKIFTFDSDSESWVDNGGGLVLSFENSDGSPNPGCLQMSLTGRNAGPASGYWARAHSFENIGVPAGATVKRIRAIYRWRCSNWYVGATGSNYSDGIAWYDGITLKQQLIGSTAFNAVTSWAEETGAWFDIDVGDQDTAKQWGFRMLGTLRCANNATANVTLRQDTVTLEVEYEVEETAITGAVSLAGLGQLAVIGEVEGYVTGKVTLDGVGVMAANAQRIVEGKAFMVGIGSMTTNAVVSGTLLADVSLQGSGTLSITSVLIKETAVAMLGLGTMSTNAEIIKQATIPMVGIGLLDVSGQVGSEIIGRVLFEGVGIITAKASRTTNASISLIGAGSLALVSQKYVGAKIAMIGAGSVAIVSQKISHGLLSYAGVGILTVTPRDPTLFILSADGAIFIDVADGCILTG